MSTYSPQQMATDALIGADPPLYSGLKSFVSDEGVLALAEALQQALDERDGVQDYVYIISER